jgi:CheY-like chemotaxis protein
MAFAAHLNHCLDMFENMIPPAGEPAGANLQFDAARPYHILIVDDEPLICRLNREVLVEAGYQVDVAEDGLAAWNKLQSHEYDLLITDHDMPKMTGVKLLLKLYANRRSLPTIMISGTMPDEELEQYPWLQTRARLNKPYGLTEFLETVENILHISPLTRSQMEVMPNVRYQPADAALRL